MITYKPEISEYNSDKIIELLPEKKEKYKVVSK